MATADKREQIMTAAEALFASRRFHEITVEEIARRAAVGKGTVYRYFADKEALFSAVAMAGFDDLCGLVSRQAACEGPFVESLERVAQALARFFGRRHRVFRLMQAEAHRMRRHRGAQREAWRARRAALQQAVCDVLVRGREQGVLRVDVPVELLAVSLLGLLRMHGRGAPLGLPDAPPVGQLMELFLHGASRQPGEAGS